MKPAEENMAGFSEAAVGPLMRAVLEKGSRIRLRVRGKSMKPFIQDGDQITLAPLSHRPLSLGDVVAFCRSNEQQKRLVIHRIVDRQENGFVIQGDGVSCESEVVLPFDILGRVVEVRRKGRRLRFGLGPERRFLAWMSRTRLLHRVFAKLGRVP